MSSKRFFAGSDIAGQPSVRFRGHPEHWQTVITWPGAYLGAFWRNLLGRFYMPWGPEKRRILGRGIE